MFGGPKRINLTRLGLLCSWIVLTSAATLADWIDGKMPVRQADAVAPLAVPAPLENVRLTPSVFADVQNLE